MKFWRWFSPKTPTYTADWLIVGLGNPGAEYQNTRHNVGQLAITALATEPFTQVKGLPVAVSAVDIAGGPVLLALPTTYMNLSGEAIAPLSQKLAVAPDKIIVLHDELDLPLGKVRLKQGGNENGHNGLKSTSAELGSKDYVRIRMGISRPPAGMSVPEYVLSPLASGAENDQIVNQMVDTAADAVRLIVSEGLSKAQNQIHARR